MRLNLQTTLRIAALVATLGWSVAAMADDRPSPTPGVALFGASRAPDISGLWQGTILGEPGGRFAPGRGPADGRDATFWNPWPLPYTPPYRKIADERVVAAKAGRQLGDSTASCFPFGMPRALVSKSYPDEIVQTPGQVAILVNSTFPIMIWTDGRGHPKNLAPSYNGHSIGYWVGDTLFVDTVGLNGITALDVARNPHSAKLHMKSTIQHVSKEMLHIHVTLYDDDAFTEPVVTTNIWQQKSGPVWQVYDDGSCFENNQNLPDATGAIGFKTF